MRLPDVSSICAELFEQLSEIAYSAVVNEIGLARIEKNAEEAKDSDPLNFLFIKAAANCIKGDEDLCRKYHLQAIAFEARVESYYNFAVSLSRLGRLLESLEYVQKAMNLAPTDEGLAEFKKSLLDRIEGQMWDDMDNDTDDFLTEVCMSSFHIGDAHS